MIRKPHVQYSARTDLEGTVDVSVTAAPHDDRHAFRPDLLLQSSDAEDGVGGAVTAIAAPFDDLEEEAFPIGAAIELEEFAVFVAVVEDVFGLQPFAEFRVKAESRFDVVVIVGGNVQGPKPVLFQYCGRCEDIVCAGRPDAGCRSRRFRP